MIIMIIVTIIVVIPSEFMCILIHVSWNTFRGNTSDNISELASLERKNKLIYLNVQKCDCSSLSALFVPNENKLSLSSFPGNYQGILNLTWGSWKPHIMPGKACLWKATSSRDHIGTFYLISFLISSFFLLSGQLFFCQRLAFLN